MIGGPNCENCGMLVSSFFNKLDKNDLAALNVKKCSTVYKKGKTIFCAGTRPGAVYCLNKGIIKTFKYGASGKEQIIRFVMPGELFGIRALLTDRTYNTTATVLEEAVVCAINKADFQQIINKYPQINMQLMGLLSQRLEEADNRVTSLAQKTVRERLAECLIYLYKTFHGDSPLHHNDFSERAISLSREDMANLIGTSTESVIRLLSEFKSDNFIAIKGWKIYLVDIRGLMKTGNIFE